jgi:hypothetical protein
MSWQMVNDILGKALFDQSFAKLLLSDPLHAVREGGFDLTAEELDVLLAIRAENIIDLSRQLRLHFKND